jgi:hypothetical protein
MSNDIPRSGAFSTANRVADPLCEQAYGYGVGGTDVDL